MSILLTSLLIITPLVASNPVSIFATKPPPHPPSKQPSIPRILAGLVISVFVVGIVVFFCICCRRSSARKANAKVFRPRPRNPNPTAIEMIPTIPDVPRLPVRMPQPQRSPPPLPPRIVPFPTPSLPSRHSPISPPPVPPFPPRISIISTESRSPMIHTSYDSVPNSTWSPSVSSLSREHSISSTQATVNRHNSSAPTMSSPPSQTTEPYSSHATTSIAGHLSTMPLGQEMVAYQKQLRAEERRNSSDGPSNDPPPRYSE